MVARIAFPIFAQFLSFFEDLLLNQLFPVFFSLDVGLNSGFRVDR